MRLRECQRVGSQGGARDPGRGLVLAGSQGALRDLGRGGGGLGEDIHEGGLVGSDPIPHLRNQLELTKCQASVRSWKKHRVSLPGGPTGAGMTARRKVIRVAAAEMGRSKALPGAASPESKDFSLPSGVTIVSVPTVALGHRFAPRLGTVGKGSVG